jgi:hypothetical protein
MKYSFQWLSILVFALISCGKPGAANEHPEHDEPEDNDPNEALYNQVDEKHMEVMMKMDDLYKYKVKLSDKIAKEPGMAPARKKEIEGLVSGLDSADHAMKEWMHGWMNSPADTADAEKMRAYFESEMESIKKLADQINDISEKAKSELDKK